MKTVTRVFCAAVCALALLWAAALTAPAAHAEPAYQDGEYTVSLISSGGSGRIVWDSPVTLHIKDGVIYADLSLSKPSGDIPSVEWIFICDNVQPQDTDFSTSLAGTRYPTVINEAAKNCSVSGAQLPNLGELTVYGNTTKMSDEHVIQYILHIDDSAIPVVSDTSTQPEQPASQPEQPAQPGGDDLLVQQPEETTAPPDGAQDSMAEVPDDALTTGSEPVDGEDTMEITSAQPDEETLTAQPGGSLSPAAVAAIAVSAVAVLGGGVYAIIRAGKAKKDES